jgi:hypothetical protein
MSITFSILITLLNLTISSATMSPLDFTTIQWVKNLSYTNELFDTTLYKTRSPLRHSSWMPRIYNQTFSTSLARLSRHRSNSKQQREPTSIASPSSYKNWPSKSSYPGRAAHRILSPTLASRMHSLEPSKARIRSSSYRLIRPALSCRPPSADATSAPWKPWVLKKKKQHGC